MLDVTTKTVARALRDKKKAELELKQQIEINGRILANLNRVECELGALRNENARLTKRTMTFQSITRQLMEIV